MLTKYKNQILTALCLTLIAGLMSSPEVLALNEGAEMGESAKRLADLLNGNVMNVIMVVGLAVSVGASFYKSSFVPVAIGVGSGVLYGFAMTWVDATFTLCV